MDRNAPFQFRNTNPRIRVECLMPRLTLLGFSAKTVVKFRIAKTAKDKILSVKT
jgi:hypothetical protein